ncbi:multiheme c-type cytochrome [Desulfovibrio inopinatus]|uniref:multiheme c-type cytochrome n=1 Tax=Desulfovibrio inopinatus TaxID=102109 RepID=UPI0004006F68|nr:multiheme c-type cytochrome [Desulfovibrio inopinatus]
MKTTLRTRFSILGLALLLALAIVGVVAAQDTSSQSTASEAGGKTPNFSTAKDFRISRAMTDQAVACIECHKQTTPGIFGDWAKSRHASANISCIDCHMAKPEDNDIATDHAKYYDRAELPYGKRQYEVPVAAVVTPKDCSRCHPDEAEQYSRSKHANTLEIIWKIDPWLNDGMNSAIERKTGCFACHGTIVAMKDGKVDPATWPNVGVGRLNLDGSKGSCTSCHTRHRFNTAEARKPDACDQCHLGPDHPQIEIFEESKHGAIYSAYQSEYNFDAAPGTWTAGVDYRAPTCAACHMSGTGTVRTSHDVTERLSWETQAPLTVRPSDFAAFPAKTDWKVERDKMKNVCQQCHSDGWINDFYTGFDGAVEEYNTVYFIPAKKKLDEMYEKGVISKDKFFDEGIEVEFYELWHHEGRRARMGTMMMAPDYAWWHGFYELKKRYNNYMEEASHLIDTGEKAYRYPGYPAATGSTQKPPQIFGSSSK